MNKIEKWSQFKKSYESRGKQYALCAGCVEANKFDAGGNVVDEQTADIALSAVDALPDGTDDPAVKNILSSASTTSASSRTTSNNDDSFDNLDDLNRKVDQINDSLLASNRDNLDKIKQLEYELARVKLELVDAQCKNQEYDHRFKSLNMSNNPSSSLIAAGGSNYSTTTPVLSNGHEVGGGGGGGGGGVAGRSNSTNSQVFYNDANTTPSNRSSSSFGSNSTLNSTASGANSGAVNNGNNWLSKTFTQFKEATNQVVQKAQKTKIPNVASPILDQLKN
jgi:hypothetical protein